MELLTSTFNLGKRILDNQHFTDDLTFILMRSEIIICQCDLSENSQQKSSSLYRLRRAELTIQC